MKLRFGYALTTYGKPMRIRNKQRKRSEKAVYLTKYQVFMMGLAMLALFTLEVILGILYNKYNVK